MLRQGLLKLNCPRLLSTRGFAGRIDEYESVPLDSGYHQEATVTVPRMEKSINQVTLLGRVGLDPQLRGTEEHPVTVFSLATHTNFKQPSGDIQQKTEWHRICVFRPFLRDSVYKYMQKGQRCLVQGKIMYGQVMDASGTSHPTTSIIADDVIFLNKSSASKVEE